MATAEPRHERPPFLGKLDRRRGGNALEKAQEVRRVKKEITEEVSERNLKAAEDLGNVEFFPKGQLTPSDNLHRHLRRLSEKDEHHGGHQNVDYREREKTLP